MRFALAAAASLMLLPASAGATYSIVATDGDTDQVGGAGTSCVGSLDVAIIYASAPGIGAVHAQAQVNTNGRDEAAQLLGDNLAPADIIAMITAPQFDGNASARQYGVVDLTGRAAAHTGSTNGVFAGDRQGTIGPFTYSVQGNILTSEAVLTQAEAAFGGGCDLADRLMLALEAGAQNGEGDSRCTGGGIPSDSGFLHVDNPDGSVLVHISVTDTGPQSPLPELRQMYDAWRATNPCPIDAGATPDGGTTGGPDGGPGNNGDGPDESGGCGCQSAGGGGAALWLMALVAIAWRRARTTARG